MTNSKHHPELILRPGSERTPLTGHPWIFSGAIARRPADVHPGGLVDVLGTQGRFIGRGFYNSKAEIAVRLLSRDRNRPIDREFFHQTIKRALALRQTSRLSDHTNAYRLVHGENDGLPGLVADYYDGFLVVQFHTCGMELFRPLVLEALWDIVRPKGLYERSDVGTRQAEGLADRPTGPLRGDEPPQVIPIEEHDAQLFVDVYRGQKTGFFLDQRANRHMLQRYAQGQSLLNCFAYTGGFSAHALRGGARRTLNVDIAPQGIPTAQRNLAANQRADVPCDYVLANVFSFIDELAQRRPRFDIVVLDPPSLLRRRSALKQAMGVYTKLNRNALKLIRSGGLLVTASCSGRVSQEDFFQVVRRAAAGAGVETRLLAYNQHAPDHPVDLAFPEGRYLKCMFARVFR